MLEKYSYRIVKAKWTSGGGGDAKFLAGIRVTGADEVGIISTFTQLISQDRNVSLRGFNVESKDGLFEGKITLFISDIEHLDSFIRRIKGLKGIHNASRFDARG